MKEKNAAAVLLGKQSARKRFKGKKKKEISEIMRRVAQKRYMQQRKKDLLTVS